MQNKMRDRLVELIYEARKEWDVYFNDCLLKGNPRSKTLNEFIADHLIENGVIVPPCKVGDKLYFVCVDEICEDYIDKGKVYAISQNENTLWFSVRYLSGLRYDHTSSDFGKTVFLTKEEAEQKLKGGVDSDNK
jgi:hypothetical protein